MATDKELLANAEQLVDEKARPLDDMLSDMEDIIKNARSVFKNSEKGLGQQIILGSKMPKLTKDSDFICWKKSPWELLTGVRGCPFGRICQIAGKPDSGKTTAAMTFLKNAQQQAVIPILWDVEGKFDTMRFDHKIGGKSDNLFVVTSKLILEGADMVDALIESVNNKFPTRKIFLVWDSVGGSLSVSEEAKDKRSGKQMAEAAKENGAVVRGFVQQAETLRNRKINEERLAVLLINQTYANIGSHGQKESGGQKVEFHSSIIVQMTRTGDLQKVRNKVPRKVGITSRMKLRKNHLFDAADCISELTVHVMANGMFVDPKSAAYSLLEGVELSDVDLVEDSDELTSAEDES